MPLFWNSNPHEVKQALKRTHRSMGCIPDKYYTMSGVDVFQMEKARKPRPLAVQHPALSDKDRGILFARLNTRRYQLEAARNPTGDCSHKPECRQRPRNRKAEAERRQWQRQLAASLPNRRNSLDTPSTGSTSPRNPRGTSPDFPGSQIADSIDASPVSVTQFSDFHPPDRRLQEAGGASSLTVDAARSLQGPSSASSLTVDASRSLEGPSSASSLSLDAANHLRRGVTAGYSGAVGQGVPSADSSSPRTAGTAPSRDDPPQYHRPMHVQAPPRAVPTAPPNRDARVTGWVREEVSSTTQPSDAVQNGPRMPLPTHGGFVPEHMMPVHMRLYSAHRAMPRGGRDVVAAAPRGGRDVVAAPRGGQEMRRAMPRPGGYDAVSAMPRGGGHDMVMPRPGGREMAAPYVAAQPEDPFFGLPSLQ